MNWEYLIFFIKNYTKPLVFTESKGFIVRESLKFDQKFMFILKSNFKKILTKT